MQLERDDFQCSLLSLYFVSPDVISKLTIVSLNTDYSSHHLGFVSAPYLIFQAHFVQGIVSADVQFYPSYLALYGYPTASYLEPPPLLLNLPMIF